MLPQENPSFNIFRIKSFPKEDKIINKNTRAEFTKSRIVSNNLSNSLNEIPE